MSVRPTGIALLKRETLIVALGGKCSCNGDGCWRTGGMCPMTDYPSGDVAGVGKARLVRTVLGGYRVEIMSSAYRAEVAIRKQMRYCLRFCGYHPKITGDKAIGFFPYVCAENGRRYLLKEEHSKGRPILRRRDCPLVVKALQEAGLVK